MTQSVRQNRLFAAEDYTAVYESYVNANFQAYDYDTIRSAMVDYVRNNYPENYNDWIESSEFVAILDLIAQFGHNLAYRIDLNSRNNFLSTAERQDAIYKLSEFLGYQPQRNLPAYGQLKVVSIKTNEAVIGGQGTSLGGQEIRYENNATAENLDNFVTVMNAVLSSVNQFGSPKKQAIINSITTQFYDLRNTANQVYFDIAGTVLGSSQNFNVISLGYDSDIREIVENEPNPAGAFGILYKNDGRGIASNNTGFFLGIKQGNLQYKDFVIDNPISGITLDIDEDNINNTDVWVQTINESGNVQKSWTRVDNVFGNNAVYNSISSGVRDIFAVKSRANNQISIQFSDERFGNIPRNIIRVWYRTSVNSSYVLRPDDIGNKKISINYVGTDGNIYTAVFGIALKESVSNASANESNDSIKTNAPRIYAAQDRMITAQDYSSYLLSQSSNILKIKGVNRTHSGHSRYLDFNDPTGTYTNIRMFATDGVLERTYYVDESLVNDIRSELIYKDYVAPIISNSEVINLYYDGFKTEFESIAAGNTTTFLWQGVKAHGDVSSGYFTDGLSIQRVGKVTTYLKYITVGSLVKFKTPDDEYKWAKVSNIFADGLGVDDALGNSTGKRKPAEDSVGAILLDAIIPELSEIEIIYPAFSRQFTLNERTIITEFIKRRRGFAVRYNYAAGEWVILDTVIADPLSDFSSLDFNNTDDSWIIYVSVDDQSGKYTLYTRKVRYTLSSDQIEFSNITNEYYLDEQTKKKGRDYIDVLFNDLEYRFYIYGYELDDNFNTLSSKVIVSLEDYNNDSRPDNPDSFNDIVATGDTASSLRFEWTHVPAMNEIVDPSFTNIIDVFALTRNYDSLFRSWLVDSSGNVSEPLPPTVDELNQQFNQVSNKKAMSDKIIYRPVKYKPLFGQKAIPELQATFRIVKVPNTRITENEIRNRAVSAISQFFDVNNWDFGETFYFTELAAYVHQQMPGVISSFVIVPRGANSVFGDLFQITPASDELFIPDVSVSDIDIIDNITQQTIRAR
jgi:hypothetical protein